jgi:hypothetical protein
VLDGISLSDVAAFATAIGVGFAAWALVQQRYQARAQFEDTIVQQYRELIKPRLLTNALLADLISNVPEGERERVQQVYLYLDLCNEQVFLRAIGRVSRSTWRVQWSEGIRGNVRDNPTIAADWQRIKDATHDFAELRRFESSGWSDPKRWEPIWRRVLIRLGVATLRPPGAT